MDRLFKVTAKADGSVGHWRIIPSSDPAYVYIRFEDQSFEAIDARVIKLKNLDKIIAEARAAGIEVEQL